MNYSAGLASTSFWFLESKLTAELMVDGKSRKEILDLAINENIFQVNTETRCREISNTVYKRLNSLPKEFIEYLLVADSSSAKLVVLISILKTDSLFFEFMYEVFQEHIILGNYVLKNSDFHRFYISKANQSEIVENWTEETVARLKRAYVTMLSEANILEKENNDYKINLPFLDYRLRKLLEKENLTPFINIFTGEN